MTIRNSGFKVNPLIAILVVIIFMAILYFILKGFYTFASWIMPIVVIATLFIDYKVYPNYFKMLGQRLKNDTFNGALWIGGSILMSPFVALYLFFQSLFNKKINNLKQEMDKKKGEFVNYEEVESTTIRLEEFTKKAEQATKGNNTNGKFDDFFK